jgi:hypothetical protein
MPKANEESGVWSKNEGRKTQPQLHVLIITRVPRARGRVQPVKPGETVQHQGTVRSGDSMEGEIDSEQF